MENKKHILKRTAACITAVLMILTAVPMSGFSELQLPKLSQLFSVKASAAAVYRNGFYTYTVSGGKATITDFDDSVRGSVVIPSKLGGYPVTCIGKSAFVRCRITNVTIPNSVTKIGEAAFIDSYSLKKVTIPNSVTEISAWAFKGCSEMTSVFVPASVKHIGYFAFGLCEKLTSISVDKNNRYYSGEGGVLFNKAKTILRQYPSGNTRKSYTIPGSVTEISDAAFSSCQLTNITISNRVTTIGYEAFVDCIQLTSIIIPSSVTMIKDNAFATSINLKNAYYLGSAKQWNSMVRVGYQNEFLTRVLRYHESHTWKTTTTKATTKANGKIAKTCTVCKKTSSTVTIPMIQSVKLSRTSYTYNGEVKTPSVTVMDSKGKTLKKGTDYTVTYDAGRKKPGTYKVKITFKGNYSGTSVVNFTISVGKVTGLKQIKQSGYQLAIEWNSVPEATGYQVYQYDAKNKKWVFLGTSTSLKIGFRKATGTYYFRIRAFVKIDGKTYYGAYSDTLTTKS